MVKKGLVLLIEDEEDLLNLYGMVVSRAGYEVESILDGKDALERLDRDPIPAIILLDMHLPSVAGDKILKAMRANKKWTKVPIYILTADVQIAQKYRDISPKAAHPDGVIEKGSNSIYQLRKIFDKFGK